MILLGAFLTFYLHSEVEVFCSATPHNKKIVEGIPLVKKGYTPTIWAINSLLHAYITTFRKPKSLKYQRMTLYNSYNQRIEVDCLNPWNHDNHTPIAVIIPGIGGHSEKDYIKTFVPHVAEKYLTYIFNHPGNGNTRLNTSKLHAMGDAGDLKLVFDSIRKQHPNSKMISIGISLGGNLLALYLGTYGKDTPLISAVTVCQAFELYNGIHLLPPKIEKGLLDNFLLMVKNNADIFKDVKNFNIEKVLKSKNFSEFDDNFTSLIHEGVDMKEYYQSLSSNFLLHNIQIPMLMLHTRDDPIISKTLIQYDSIKNENLIVMVVERGGHGSFLTGGIYPNLDKSWIEEFLVEYLDVYFQSKLE
eukprot:gene8032-12497_t